MARRQFDPDGSADRMEILCALVLEQRRFVVFKDVNEADVDDVLSDAHVRVIRGMGKLKDWSKRREWVQRVVHSAVQEYWRQKLRLQERITAMPYGEAVDNDDPAEILIAQESISNMMRDTNDALLRPRKFIRRFEHGSAYLDVPVHFYPRFVFATNRHKKYDLINLMREGASCTVILETIFGENSISTRHRLRAAIQSLMDEQAHWEFGWRCHHLTVSFLQQIMYQAVYQTCRQLLPALLKVQEVHCAGNDCYDSPLEHILAKGAIWGFDGRPNHRQTVFRTRDSTLEVVKPYCTLEVLFMGKIDELMNRNHRHHSIFRSHDRPERLRWADPFWDARKQYRRSGNPSEHLSMLESVVRLESALRSNKKELAFDSAMNGFHLAKQFESKLNIRSFAWAKMLKDIIWDIPAHDVIVQKG